MLLPQMARQMPAVSGSDHLRGSRQVLVHYAFHQMAGILEHHGAL